MNVYCLGNMLLPRDSLPLKILPRLKRKLPGFNFIKYDPTEELPDEAEKLVLIDTVLGIKKITIFNSLSAFSPSPNVSVHDYDLFLELSLRKKLRKLNDFLIIGVPDHILPDKAVAELCEILVNQL